DGGHAEAAPAWGGGQSDRAAAFEPEPLRRVAGQSDLPLTEPLEKTVGILRKVRSPDRARIVSPQGVGDRIDVHRGRLSSQLDPHGGHWGHEPDPGPARQLGPDPPRNRLT